MSRRRWRVRRVVAITLDSDILECGHVRHYIDRRPAYAASAVLAGRIKVGCHDCVSAERAAEEGR